MDEKTFIPNDPYVITRFQDELRSGAVDLEGHPHRLYVVVAPREWDMDVRRGDVWQSRGIPLGCNNLRRAFELAIQSFSLEWSGVQWSGVGVQGQSGGGTRLSTSRV